MCVDVVQNCHCRAAELEMELEGSQDQLLNLKYQEGIGNMRGVTFLNY